MKHKTHRLLIRVIDDIQEGMDKNGNVVRRVSTKWIEADSDINCGSLKNPNKNILEFRFEPIQDERRIKFFDD